MTGESFVPTIPLKPAEENFVPATPLEPAEENFVPATPLQPAKRITSFQEMYDFFLAGITDDMFMEMTKEDTEEMLEEILLAALPHFEFPRWEDPFDIDIKHKCFTTQLSMEEMMIIRQYMISEWIGFQLASVNLVKQLYSGSDFKFTSQASHMKQLTTLKKEYETKGFHLQRVYCRRKKSNNGRLVSTFGQIMEPIS